MPLASFSAAKPVGQERGGHCLHSLRDGLTTLHLHYSEFSDITKYIAANIQQTQEQLDNMTFNIDSDQVYCDVIHAISLKDARAVAHKPAIVVDEFLITYRMQMLMDSHLQFIPQEFVAIAV
jgi:hypothetical protein